MPGDGRWPLSPVAMEDLARCVVAAVECEATGVFEVGSPQPITLRWAISGRRSGSPRHWRCSSCDEAIHADAAVQRLSHALKKRGIPDEVLDAALRDAAA